jgi:hypothetical protein
MNPTLRYLFAIVGFALFLNARSAFCADTVFLKNGSEIDGSVTQDDEQSVSIKLNNGSVRSFKRSDVELVVRCASKPSEANAPPAPVVNPPPAKDNDKKKETEPTIKKKPVEATIKPNSNEAPGIKVGSVAPPIEGKKWFTKDGKAPEMKDKIYLVDFWFKG